LRDVLKITWYVGEVEEWIGVGDLLLGNEHVTLVMYVHE
jgi:hypothetical protein